MKTVVHISENSDEAATRAFNNLQNLSNTPAVESAVLVANGPGVNVLFEDSPHHERVREAIGFDRVSLRACANTLKMMDRSSDELVVGVELAADGGVVELTRLQSEGYAYIKVP